jgi:hypothetical protein
MEVVEDVLGINAYKQILNSIDNSNFPWHYKQNVHYPHLSSSDIASHGFLHIFYWDEQPRSQYFDLALNILLNICDKLNYNFDQIIRMHAALTLNVGKQHYGFPHTDMGESSDFWNNKKWKTVVYYLNESDGDTVLYNGKDIFKKISVKKNKAIIFDGQTYHSAMLPMLNPYRITLNFNFLIG